MFARHAYLHHLLPESPELVLLENGLVRHGEHVAACTKDRIYVQERVKHGPNIYTDTKP